MDWRGFKAAELVKLLAAAKKAGVRTLQLGDFFVEFSKDGKTVEGQPQEGFGEGAPQVDTLQNDGQTSLELFNQEELLEMERAQQLIDDPEAFETDIIRAHVEKSRMRAHDDNEDR